VVADPTVAAGLTEAVAEAISMAAVVADSVATAAEHFAQAAPTAARGLSEQEVRTAAEALVEDRRMEGRRRVATEPAEVLTADSIHRAA
jgi:hypothetical protein